MCGICGIVSFESGPVDRAELGRMRDAMIHRGPDDGGDWISADGRVGLGHRRLSILDLSPAGSQPMADSSGKHVLVLNGEIYNFHQIKAELQAAGHTFCSRSDTEVLLASYREWGVDCLRHLNGMFAFAIYDAEEHQLFLARDRAGEKPLFYLEDKKFFCFASELKSIMSLPACERRIDPQALLSFLSFGYVAGPRCILQKCRKLPPAAAMVVDLNTGKTRGWTYWQIPEQQHVPEIGMAELTDELEELLSSSVRQQLVADVPVGILLSGGVDSSLVTAIAARVSSSPVRTYTIRFPGAKIYDEGPHASKVARHFGTEHTELHVEPTSVELLATLARQFDEPMCDSSMVPTYLVSKTTRQHCTVALGGDGGDELFGGYVTYQLALGQALARNLLPQTVRKLVAWPAQRWMPLGFRGRNYLIGLAGSPVEALLKNRMLFDPYQLRRLYKPLECLEAQNAALIQEFVEIGAKFRRGLPGMAMALDFQTYLPEDILVKVDRASMLTSLEVRAPLLDYRIIEFAFSRIPDRMRTTLHQRKIILRQLAARLLPPEFDLQRKQGFSIPARSWFKGEWGEYCTEVLHNLDQAVWDLPEIQGLIKGQHQGLVNIERIFALVLLELWRREYRVSLT